MTEPSLGAVRIGGMTRGAFILRGAFATGAAVGLSGVAPFVTRALAQSGANDVDTLNFALTLEHLEATFYREALDRVGGLDGRARALTEQLAEDEAAHVEALTKTIEGLKGRPVAAPEVDFGDAFSSVASYLELASTFEDTGVGAYNGAAPAIRATEILAAAGSIVQVEARHAALIRLRRDEEPAPRPFEPALRRQEVLDRVEPFLRS